MNDTSPQVVRSYLSELESALHGVPTAVQHAILGGVREELTGLDAAAAAARIEEFGDPAFIAAEARAEAATDERPAPATTEGAWYPVVASLLVAFGGFVIPLVGWIAGITMVWLSTSWRKWEKWVATLAVPAFTLLLIGITSLVSLIVNGSHPVNPWMPYHLDVLTLAILPGVLTIPAGLWLLWRARRLRTPLAVRRGEKPATSTVVASLLVAFGGILVPVIGWMAGMTLVWVSRAWRTWEKLVASLVPFVSVGVGLLLMRLLAADARSSAYVLGISGILWLYVVVTMIVLTAASGLWLLWRARPLPAR
jgi:uncharacterized membrane protein